MKKILRNIIWVAVLVGTYGCDSKPDNHETNAIANTLEQGKPVEASHSEQASDYAQLAEYLNALHEQERVLGSIGIYREGKQDFTKAYVLEGNQVIESDEVYRYKIGSISKTFTAVLVFQLIEQGKLTLETSLATFYPEIVNADEITIKMLLNHRSGIYNFTNSEDFTNYFTTSQDQSEMLQRIQAFEPAFEPDSKAEYSNSNYLLLGYILESVTGKDYGELVQANIAKPLALQATYLEQITEPEKNEVFSYIRNNGWQQVPQWDMSVADAAGALVSTTPDLNRFFKALFDGELISQTSLETMISEQDNYGHGIFKREVEIDGNEYIGYWHNGGIENFRSEMIYFPQSQTGVAFLSNGSLYEPNKIHKGLVQAAFGQSLEIPQFKSIELSAEQLAPYVGDYSSETHPLDIKVLINQDKLFAQATGQGAFPLTAIEDNVFEFAAAGIEMTFDPDNKQFVIKQGGRADIFSEKNRKKISEKIKIDQQLLEAYVGVYKADDFPLDIEVMLKDGDLSAQATGQPAFPLTPVNDSEFKFDLAGIVIKFDANQKQLAITQHGNTNIMTKE